MSRAINAIMHSWTAKIGLLGMAIGLVLMLYTRISGLPSRGELRVVEGIVTEGTRITHSSAKRGITSVKFQLTITPQGKTPIKLTIPSDEITQQQAVSVLDGAVRAEYDSDNDVYALLHGNRVIIDYDTARAKRSTALQAWADASGRFLFFGANLVVIGWFLGARKLRKQAAAAHATST